MKDIFNSKTISILNIILPKIIQRELTEKKIISLMQKYPTIPTAYHIYYPFPVLNTTEENQYKYISSKNDYLHLSNLKLMGVSSELIKKEFSNNKNNNDIRNYFSPSVGLKRKHSIIDIDKDLKDTKIFGVSSKLSNSIDYNVVIIIPPIKWTNNSCSFDVAIMSLLVLYNEISAIERNNMVSILPNTIANTIANRFSNEYEFKRSWMDWFRKSPIFAKPKFYNISEVYEFIFYKDNDEDELFDPYFTSFKYLQSSDAGDVSTKSCTITGYLPIINKTPIFATLLDLWEARISEITSISNNISWPKVLLFINDQYQQNPNYFTNKQSIEEIYNIKDSLISYQLLGVYYCNGSHYKFRFKSPSIVNSLPTNNSTKLMEFDGMKYNGNPYIVRIGSRSPKFPYLISDDYYVCGILLIRSN